MMTNLFSMFDPSNFFMKMSWLLTMIMLMTPFLKNNTKLNTLTKKTMIFIKKELFSSSNSNLNNNLMLPIFMSILVMNIISMIPCSFAPTTQMSFIIPITIPLWLMSFSFFMMKKTNKFLSHLVPSGSPSQLMPSLVLIELISNLIRPITLTVRLTANLTAGHLMMHLLSSLSCSMLNNPLFPLPFMLSLILTTLEISVAFIQSYILCTLISLYSSEIK